MNLYKQQKRHLLYREFLVKQISIGVSYFT